MEKYYIIKDWAGNIMFGEERFKNWDDAEDFLSENLGDSYEEYRGDIYITEIERENNYERY